MQLPLYLSLSINTSAQQPHYSVCCVQHLAADIRDTNFPPPQILTLRAGPALLIAPSTLHLLHGAEELLAGHTRTG
jgi:hypothetical protein